MRSCTRCLENNWSFEKIENIIRATCNNCNYEVEFSPKNKRELKQGDPCRNCRTPIELKEPRNHKPDSPFYYSAYYFCPSCRRMYMAEKFKVYRNS